MWQGEDSYQETDHNRILWPLIALDGVDRHIVKERDIYYFAIYRELNLSYERDTMAVEEFVLPL